MADDHYKKVDDARLVPDGPDAVAEAHRLHRLATADPEPERDGTMTGPAHEEKYGLERAEFSADYWRSVGVHPTENRALRPGDDGFEAAAEAGELGAVETADAPKADNSAAAARVKK
jgi:hypothetical protein